jgi:membrane-anchored protein YejM (alkaline phosphatase superfamily)
MNELKYSEYFNWCKWFVVSNIVVFYLLGLLYLKHLPAPVDTYATLFLVFTLLGHLGILCLIAFVPVTLFLFLWPRFSSVVVLSVITSALCCVILFIDIYIFVVFSFRMNFMLLKVFMTFDTVEFFGMNFIQTMVVYSIASFFLLVEIGLAFLFWKLRNKLTFKISFNWIIILILCCEGISQGLYAYAYATGEQSTLQNSRTFPGYIGVEANNLFTSLHLLDKKQIVYEPRKPDFPPNSTLNYPLHSLQDGSIKNAPNIVIIAIDTWRADTLLPEIMPNVTAFSKQASVFHNHFSGGNSTLSGLYTFYYSIPSLYWNATNVAPIFFNILTKYHYRQQVLFSAGMKYPPFYKNIFSTVPDLQIKIPGKEPYQRDETITQDALQFLDSAKSNKTPFFMFVFYDAVHSGSLDPNYPRRFEPIAHDDLAMLTNDTDPTIYFNLYKDLLYYDDHLVGQVLAKLKAMNLLDNTIVIITSDHGQEFNDNHHNYWGHVSNFTQYQIKVPLIIYFPKKYSLGKKPQQIYTQTSHYDVMPTLLQDVFKVSNPISDYSIGENLFTTQGWTILPVGSYNYEGLIAPPYIYNFYPQGVTAVYDMQGNLQQGVQVNPEEFRRYREYMQTYYKEKNK